MLTEATQEIMTLVESEEQRKEYIGSSIRKLQERKRMRQFRLLRDQYLMSKIDNSSVLVRTHRILKFVKDAGKLMKLNRDLSEQRRKFARVDNAIGETMHWTAQSEHESKRDRREALMLAKQSAVE